MSNRYLLRVSTYQDHLIPVNLNDEEYKKVMVMEDGRDVFDYFYLSDHRFRSWVLHVSGVQFLRPVPLRTKLLIQKHQEV